MRYLATLATVSSILGARVVAPQSASPGNESELSKQSQNPVGTLVSVPVQYNFTLGGSLAGQTSYTMKVQPVVPMPIGAEWNVIVRPIVPFVSVQRDDGGRWRGVGDVNLEAFFVSRRPSPVTVGFGPLISFPTATTIAAHTGALGAGPAVVVVRDTGPFVLSALVTQLWSFAGDAGHAEINTLSLQPAVNYNLPNGWAIATSPQLSADFTIHDGDRWTIPVGASLSKTTRIGNQPLSVSMQYYNYVVRPRNSAASLLRFGTTFLFPSAPAK